MYEQGLKCDNLKKVSCQSYYQTVHFDLGAIPHITVSGNSYVHDVKAVKLLQAYKLTYPLYKMTTTILQT